LCGNVWRNLSEQLFGWLSGYKNNCVVVTITSLRKCLLEGGQTCLYAQATESIRGNGTDAYLVVRAFTHFSAQRIIARKQYSWTRKICEVQVAGSRSEPEPFAFRATALKLSRPHTKCCYLTVICDFRVIFISCSMDCHGRSLKGRSLYSIMKFYNKVYCILFYSFINKQYIYYEKNPITQKREFDYIEHSFIMLSNIQQQKVIRKFG